MAHWAETYRTEIADCEARESRLTEWEQKFLQSLTEQIDRNLALSVKQIDTLDRIWEKVTRNG